MLVTCTRQLQSCTIQRCQVLRQWPPSSGKLNSDEFQLASSAASPRTAWRRKICHRQKDAKALSRRYAEPRRQRKIGRVREVCLLHPSQLTTTVTQPSPVSVYARRRSDSS